MRARNLFAAAGIAALTTAAIAAPPITYDGSLAFENQPVTREVELRFTVFAGPAGGVPLAEPVWTSAVPDAAGDFQVDLDFGADTQLGTGAWLQIEVRDFGSDDAFVTLQPRQPVAVVGGTFLGGDRDRRGGASKDDSNGSRIVAGARNNTSSRDGLNTDGDVTTSGANQGGFGDTIPGPTSRNNDNPWRSTGNGIAYRDGNVGIGLNPDANKRLHVQTDNSNHWVAYFETAGNNGGDVVFRNGMFVYDDDFNTRVVAATISGVANGILRVNGKWSKTLFHGGRAGDDSVQFEQNAINAAEIRNEAGVAHFETFSVAVPGVLGTMQSLTVTAPTDGWVIVSSVAEVNITHGSLASTVTFGLSDDGASIASNGSLEVLLPAGATEAIWKFPVHAQTVFAIEEDAADTYYLNAFYTGNGSATMFDVQTTAVFVPTAYGAAPIPLALTADETGAHYQATIPPLTQAQINAERQASIEAYQRAQAEELRELREKFDAVVRELDAMERMRDGN